jgi:hypothetical protein
MQVFLSYSRNDDEPFVKKLCKSLIKAGFDVYYDRDSLMSRGLSFHQEIRDAIRLEVGRLVYVGGPEAFQSLYVREEWKAAFEYEKFIVPILRIGKLETSVPWELRELHCEDFTEDGQYENKLTKLIGYLRLPPPTMGALHSVPNCPPHYQGRSEHVSRLSEKLRKNVTAPDISEKPYPVVGIIGEGGKGKSVLAAAVARIWRVRIVYPDGIFWIECGQHLRDSDLVNRQIDLARQLGSQETITSIAQGQFILKKLLSDKAILLILDDIWDTCDTRAFDVLTKRSLLLITARRKGIIRALNGELEHVEDFTETEALQLLAEASRVELRELPPVAKEIVRECGCLPLAIALCGGMVHRFGNKDFDNVLKRLQNHDIDRIENKDAGNKRHISISHTIEASYSMLDRSERDHFCELSAFVPGVYIPETAAHVLWNYTDEFDEMKTQDLLIELSECSMVQLDQSAGSHTPIGRYFRLHDLIYKFADHKIEDKTMLQETLLNAYQKSCPDSWASGPADGYYYQNLIRHQIMAQHKEEARALLSDFDWLVKKMGLTSINSAMRDIEFFLSATKKDTNSDAVRTESAKKFAMAINKICRGPRTEESIEFIKTTREQVDVNIFFNLIKSFYEVELLYPCIKLLVDCHFNTPKWEEVRSRLVDEDDMIVRYTLGEALAEAILDGNTEAARRKLLEDEVDSLCNESENHAKREVGLYATKFLCLSEPKYINDVLFQNLSKSTYFYDRGILAEIMIGLSLRGQDVCACKYIDHDTFWKPIWEYNILELIDICGILKWKGCKQEDCLRLSEMPTRIFSVLSQDRQEELKEFFNPNNRSKWLAESEAMRIMLLGSLSGEFLNIKSILTNPWTVNRHSLGNIQEELQLIDSESLSGFVRLMISHPSWDIREAISITLAHLANSRQDALMLMDGLIKESDWKLRYGGVEAAWSYRTTDEGKRFLKSLGECAQHPCARVRGLCAENTANWIINSQSLEKKETLLKECLPFIKQWLMDSDIWPVENMFLLLNHFHELYKNSQQNLIDIITKNHCELSPWLHSLGDKWWEKDRNDFLGSLEKARSNYKAI